MKANITARRYAALAVCALALALNGACSAPTAPAPAAAPPPRRAPPPSRPAVNWQDAPLTPGDWLWSMEGGKSVARFGGGLLALSCDRAAATVTLLRRVAGDPGPAGSELPMTIQTSSATRPLSGTARTGPLPVIAVTFPARDSLLDAMAFSRGRFAVEVAGMETLYVPSWPEVSRVIEDCR